MSGQSEAPPVVPAAAQGLVLRNAFFLVIAQVAGTPISMIVAAVMARYLGPRDFGYIYLAGTFWSFGFRLIEWGQPGTLPAMVARERSRAGEFLGSGLTWRVGATVIVFGLLLGTCRLLGYGRDFQIALTLVVAGSSIVSLYAACLDTVRGFERTDVTASTLFGQQVLTAALVIPTLLLGGHLRATLEAQIVANLITAVIIWRAVKSTGLGKLSFRRATLNTLLSQGTPFLFLGLVMVLQPNVDALLLSKLGSAEAVGWHAAARKIVGALIFPIDALVSALYPTLCRLYSEDSEAYKRNVGTALRTASIVVIPVALGCGLYADVGIRIFSSATFAPAANNLRILSLFVLLLYFSMTLGTALAAAGLQRAWAVTQFGCVALSAVLDPFLIPWFQTHAGNGGLGVCVSTVLSEVLMVVVGFWLTPAGVLNRELLKGIALAIVAGGAMVAVARVGSHVTPFLAAPVAVVAYVAALWTVGGIDKETLETLRRMFRRRK